jgi:hypothetical protein
MHKTLAMMLSRSLTSVEFFDGLAQLDKAKLMALFRIAGDHGKFFNPEKFGTWKAGCSNSSPSTSACRLPIEERVSSFGALAYEENQAQTKLTIVGKEKR